jgi:hypothetical protein
MASFRTRYLLTVTYPWVAGRTQRLKPAPSRPISERDGFLGRSNRAARAGLRVRALNAEISTDTAMVRANCW